MRNIRTRRRAVTAVLGLILACAAGCASHIQATPTDPVIGAWQVTVDGATYAPHLFAFAAGGLMFSTNPTGVQENPAATGGGTNDSVGVGTWLPIGVDSYRGRFDELNAYTNTHKAAATLVVTFTITLHGDQLTGGATATLAGKIHPATLTGTRID